MPASAEMISAFDPQRTAATAGLDGRNLPRTIEALERIERSPYGLHAMARAQADTPRPGAAGLIDWYRLRTVAQTTDIFLDKLFEALDKLPQGLRASELARILTSIEPSLEPAVRSEAERLVADGHEPRRALRAAMGAALAARRKKHYWLVQHEIIPRQAQKAVESVFAATSDPQERARRIHQLVTGLLPEKRPLYAAAQATVRLKEVGLSAAQIAAVLAAPALTEEDVTDSISVAIRAGGDPAEAVRRGIEMALRAFFLDVIKANGVAQGVEFCGVIIAAVVAAAVSLAATAAGVAVPLAQAEGARRAAARAQDRQKRAPLSAGEVEQIVGGLIRSGSTTWGQAEQQAALDYIRVNRFTRTAFVEPEARALQTAFNTARTAIVAQQEAVRKAHEQKVLIGVGLGAVALIGGALIIKNARS